MVMLLVCIFDYDRFQNVFLFDGRSIHRFVDGSLDIHGLDSLLRDHSIKGETLKYKENVLWTIGDPGFDPKDFKAGIIVMALIAAILTLIAYITK